MAGASRRRVFDIRSLSAKPRVEGRRTETWAHHYRLMKGLVVVSQPGRDLGVLAKPFETFLSGWELRVSGAIVRSAESDPILTAFRLPA
jgi:hypothetical protein